MPRRMSVHLVRDQGGDIHLTFTQKGAKPLTPQAAHITWKKWRDQSPDEVKYIQTKLRASIDDSYAMLAILAWIHKTTEEAKLESL